MKNCHHFSKPDRSEFQEMRQRLTLPFSSGRPERRKISETINPSVSRGDNVVILHTENRHGDAEQESVPNLESKDLVALSGLFRHAYLAVFLSLVASGCFSINRYRASNAYGKGDYVSANRHISEQCAEEPIDPEVATLCEDVKNGVNGMADYYLRSARSLVSKKKSIQYRDYSQAIRHWKKAIEIRGKNHPNNKIVENEIRWAEGKLASFEEEYKDQFNKLKKLLKESNYEKEVWMAITRTFERLRVLRLVLKKEDGSLTPLAIAYFYKSFEKGEYERANQTANIARALDIKETPFGREGQICEEDEDRIAANYHKNEVKKAKKEKEINELLQEIKTDLNEDRKDTAREKAEEALKKNDLTSKQRNEVKKVLAEIDGKPKGKPYRNKRGRRRKKEKKSATASDNPYDVLDNLDVAEHNPVEEAEDELGEIEKILVELNQEFEKGNEFGAIVELGRVISAFKGKHKRRLIRQRRMWEPTKKRIIRETLNQAKALFPDNEAYVLYEKVLKLNPNHKFALSQIKKLKKLDKKGQAEERQKKLKEANALFIDQKKEAIGVYEKVLKMNPTPEEKRLAESRIAKLKKAFSED